MCVFVRFWVIMSCQNCFRGPWHRFYNSLYWRDEHHSQLVFFYGEHCLMHNVFNWVLNYIIFRHIKPIIEPSGPVDEDVEILEEIASIRHEMLIV